MNAIATTTTSPGLVPHDMTGAMRLAEMMATGKLVPGHLQRSPGDCLMVIEQAMRWNMSPFAVAQCTSVVQGKLMFEGKLVAAAVQSSGILNGRLTYSFTGSGDLREIKVSGMVKGETEPRDILVHLKDARTSNGMWTKQPDQQLVYFATRAWARRHVPEVMLGVYSPEEFDAPKDKFSGQTIEAEPAATCPPKPTINDWLNDLEAELANAATAEEVDAILARDKVQSAQDKLTGTAKERLADMCMAAIERTGEPGINTEDRE